MAKDEWITTAEAAELTGYHRNHILRLLEGGKVKAQKWGIQWQVSRSSLLAYVRTVEKTGAKRGPKTTA
jgi:excisionase family DNA binding protein